MNLTSVFAYSEYFFLNHVIISEYQAVSSQTTQTLNSFGQTALPLSDMLDRNMKDPEKSSIIAHAIAKNIILCLDMGLDLGFKI